MRYNRNGDIVAIWEQNLGLCTKTIGNILRKEGLEPQPSRTPQITWKEFVKSHLESLVAIDFFTTEIYTLKELTRYMVLVAIEYSTRKVEIVGIVEQAYGTWMNQMGKNLTDPINGFLKNKRYLIPY
jgi:putative transposase